MLLTSVNLTSLWRELWSCDLTLVNRSDEGLTLETSAFLPFAVFNPVVNTKLPAILSHRRTTVSFETYLFNLTLIVTKY